MNSIIRLRYTGYSKRAGRSLPLCRKAHRGRKVRTPQGSVPDNVRDCIFKDAGRLVPQRTYRHGESRGKGEKVR